MSAPSESHLLLSVSEAMTALLGARLRVTTTEAGEVSWTIGQRATFRLGQLTKNGGVPTADASLENTVWVASYVPEALAAQLRQRGYCYADAAGNAWIEALEADLLVLVLGRPRPKRQVSVFQGAFYAHGLRILYYLLTNPVVLEYSEAALAKHTGVPLPRVRNILQDLEEQGHLTPGPNRQLVGRPELLAQWTAAYNQRLRPRLNPIRYRWLPDSGEQPDARGYKAVEAEGAWGGALAAYLLLDTDAPARITTLYFNGDRSALCGQLGLARHSKGSVEILNLFVPPDYTLRGGQVCVHPLLVYADLLHDEDEQLLPLAGQIYARFLAGEEPSERE